jgi:hypothetical protein
MAQDEVEIERGVDNSTEFKKGSLLEEAFLGGGGAFAG